MAFLILFAFALSLVLCLVLSAQHNFGLAVVCLMMSGSSVFSANSTSTGLRAEAVLLLAGMLVFRRRGESGFHLHHEQSSTLVVFVTALFLTVLTASILRNDWSMAVNASLGVLAISLLVIAPSRVITMTQFQNSLTMVLILYLSCSAVVTFLFPSIGIEQARMRGLSGNANLLGFFILLTITVTMLVEQRKRVIVLVLFLAMPSLVLTASRTSAIALLVVLVVGMIGRVGYVSRVAGLVSLSLVAFLFWGSENSILVDSAIWRTGNSRSQSWEQAVWVYHQSPLFGVGLAKGDVEVASSPLRAFVSGGAVGLAFLILACSVMLVASWRLGWASFALAVGAFAHSLGEGWLVSLTGPMVLMFVLAWIVVSSNDIDAKKEVILKGIPSVTTFRPGAPRQTL